MRDRLAVALLAIVVVPLAVLGWLSVRSVQHESDLAEHRRQAALGEPLRLFEGILNGVFEARRRALLEIAPALEVAPDSIAAFLKGRTDVRQVFAMSADGERLHPREPLSGAEADFMRRSAAIWRNREILWAGVADPAARAPTSEEPAASRSGWYVWHADAEQNHVFWWRDPHDRLLGFELDPARLLADLVAALPPTGDDAPAQLRSRLVMPSGVVLYQWGRHPIAAGEPARAVLALGGPLAGWKLESFAPPPTAAGADLAALLAGLAALAVALGGLAFFLYREHGRATRLALQRVSFVNQVSHELKTPLTNIRLYAELLDEATPVDDAVPRRYVDVIVAEAQRLSRLIGNVLDFARLQKEPASPRPQPTVVDEVVAASLAAFAPLLAAKGIAVAFAPSAGAPAMIDREILGQVLNNLLGNVEKYAGAGGRVEISTARDGDFQVIRVRDFGPGIAAAERERVFEPFYRIRSAPGDGVSGTGIGLTLARELARLHGGELALRPVDGAGACFEARLRDLGGAPA